MKTIDLEPLALREAYRRGELTPAMVLAEVDRRCEAAGDNPVWIRRLTPAERDPYLRALEGHSPADRPLYGLPFAIKDNIDLAGIPTTAACPAFAYTPTVSATVVERLIAAGAIPVGKTNLDQFATGLNGTRSPWGAVRNAWHPDYIAGGSSSGSGVAVALRQVSFALGTDTAGSGRVPAALNEVVGLKPSRGLVSLRGVVPACRSLDCVSVFTPDVGGAAAVLEVIAACDAADPCSRPWIWPEKAWPARTPVIGVPAFAQLEFFGSSQAAERFAEAIRKWEALGGQIRELDFTPFLDAASLLYAGPWVAERHTVIGPLLESHPSAVLPIIRDVLSSAAHHSAADSFRAGYRLQELKRAADRQMAQVDLMMVPTVGRAYTITALQNDPLTLNTCLGRYTNFMNLLDYCAVAVPAGRVDYRETGDPEGAVPWGVTFFAAAGSEVALLQAAECFSRDGGLHGGSEDGVVGSDGLAVLEPLRQRQFIDVLVCGAHLDGMPLNWQLRERGAALRKVTTTAPAYRFHALAGGPPFRPGLVRDTRQGRAIGVEVWSLPLQHLGSFIRLIPHPLGLGKVELADGSWVTGFICEPCALEGARDITDFGDWRRFMASLAPPAN